MLKVDFSNVDHLYTCVLKKKNTRSLYLTCMTKPTHLYTIFTEMMTHYYHFHQQNSPSSYHHRNKGSLIYLEQFQNHPIGIPKLMKMHLKTFEHPRTPCFREHPPGGLRWRWGLKTNFNYLNGIFVQEGSSGTRFDMANLKIKTFPIYAPS